MNIRFMIYLIAQVIVLLELFFDGCFDTLSQSFYVWYAIECFFALGMFFILLNKDPGQIPRSFDKNVQSSFQTSTETIQSIDQPNTVINQNNQFCTICNTPKSLRSYHCDQCKTCIPTYDHHCPYINKCIGEKNRKYFYLFLFIQTIQAFHLLISLIKIIIQTGNKNNIIIGLVSFSLIVGFIMGSLLLFETYYMLFNLTMYEYLYRKEIPYLKNEKMRHPFSKGRVRNLIQFWIQGNSQELIEWSLG